MFTTTKTLFTMAVAATTALAHGGKMTYYDPSVGVGACGEMHYDNEMVVGVDPAMYGTNPNPNLAEVCHKTIAINYNGKTTNAMVVDKCPTCASGSIDVSSAVFQAAVGNLGVGHVEVTWEFV